MWHPCLMQVAPAEQQGALQSRQAALQARLASLTDVLLAGQAAVDGAAGSVDSAQQQLQVVRLKCTVCAGTVYLYLPGPRAYLSSARTASGFGCRVA